MKSMENLSERRNYLLLLLRQRRMPVNTVTIIQNVQMIYLVWQPVAGLEQQYNTIKSVQYCTRPRLIVISQAIGYIRVPKFISSGWDVFKSLSVAQAVCY